MKGNHKRLAKIKHMCQSRASGTVGPKHTKENQTGEPINMEGFLSIHCCGLNASNIKEDEVVKLVQMSQFQRK